MMQFVDLYPFVISLLSGALIGAERQRRLAEEKQRGVAGLRTFTLISLLGTLSASMSDLYGWEFIVVAFASYMLILAIGYYSAAFSAQGRVDLTSAVAAMLTFILGAMCYFDDRRLLAVALAVVITWILATRKITHRYVEAISETDLLDTLKMGIIALVIYPFLPNQTLDPLDVINPQQIWMMVVLVSLIGYVGYVLIRILGAERGLTLIGFLGGLASSTAVTTSMASEARMQREIVSSAAFATVIASCTMFPRLLFIVALVNRDLFFPLLPQLAVMSIAGVIMAYLLFLRKSQPLEKKIEATDPFKILPALKFGAFFAFVLLASKVASNNFGDAGVYAASIIAGFADVDAITLSMSTLAKTTLDSGIAAKSITLAAITNTLVKLSLAYIMGTVEFGNKIALIFFPMIGFGLVTMYLF